MTVSELLDMYIKRANLFVAYFSNSIWLYLTVPTSNELLNAAGANSNCRRASPRAL
jgi:hypothetical protein